MSYSAKDLQPLVEQLLRLSKDALTPNTEVQSNLYKLTREAEAHDLFAHAAAVVFRQGGNMRLGNAEVKLPETSRVQQALNLKRYVHSLAWNKVHPSVKQNALNELLQCIGDNSQYIRNTAAAVLSSFAEVMQLRGWKNILATLCTQLGGKAPNAQEGSFNVLSKLCTDLDVTVWLQPELGNPLDTLIPLFIRYMAHDDARMRGYAIQCLNCFVQSPPPALVSRMEQFVDRLFRLAANDRTVSTCMAVCDTLNTLTKLRLKYLAPRMGDALSYALAMAEHKDEQLALAAGEFLMAFLDHKETEKKLLVDKLPGLVRVLLNAMLLSDHEMMIIGGYEEDEEDQYVEDSSTDVKPVIYHGRGELKGEDEEEEIGGYDQVDWSLRKCAGQILTRLSNVYEGTLWRSLIRSLEPGMKPKAPWKAREATILALGAVSAGCGRNLAEHMNGLLSHLLLQMNDRRPLLRSATCWTVSQYSAWICEKGGKKAVEEVLERLLQRTLDKNKAVQRAACTAFSLLAKQAGVRILPYIKGVLQNLSTAMSRYKQRSLITLYDTILLLVEIKGVAEGIARPDILKLIFPAMMQQLASLRYDYAGVSLLECFNVFVVAIGGEAVKPYALEIYKQCGLIVYSRLNLSVNQQQSEAGVDAVEYIQAAVDLLGRLAEVMRGDFESMAKNVQLVPGQQVNIFQLTMSCVQHESPQIRMAACGLIGEFASHCPSLMRFEGWWKRFMQQLVVNLDPGEEDVYNNASWAIGAAAPGFRADLTPYLGDILPRLAKVMYAEVDPYYAQNAAITIGRMALYVDAKTVTQFFTAASEKKTGLVHAWLVLLTKIQEDEEKQSAFQGLCALVAHRADTFVPHFSSLLCALAAYPQPPREMAQTLQRMLTSYAQYFGNVWQDKLKAIPQPALEALQRNYKL